MSRSQSILARSPLALVLVALLGTAATPRADAHVHADPQNVLYAVSGFGQTTPSGKDFPQPFAVRVEDGAGNVVPGVAVTFSTAEGGSFSPAPTVVSGADGVARVRHLAGPVPGPAAVVATIDGSMAATLIFAVTIAPSTKITAVLGDGQCASLHRATPAPLMAYVSDLDGGARPNARVTFRAVTSSGSFDLGHALSDANGVAQLAIVTPVGGEYTVHAWTPGAPLPGAAFSLFGRELQIFAASSASFVALTYRHEHGPLPLLVAIDAPMTPVTTVHGAFHTSILQPGPALIVLDGIGLYGPSDSSVVANPTWVHFAQVPPALAGLQRTIQVYAYDAAYEYPRSVIVSNPVTQIF